MAGFCGHHRRFEGVAHGRGRWYHSKWYRGLAKTLTLTAVARLVTWFSLATVARVGSRKVSQNRHYSPTYIALHCGLRTYYPTNSTLLMQPIRPRYYGRPLPTAYSHGLKPLRNKLKTVEKLSAQSNLFSNFYDKYQFVLKFDIVPQPVIELYVWHFFQSVVLHSSKEL